MLYIQCYSRSYPLGCSFCRQKGKDLEIQGQLHEELMPYTCCMDKASHLTAFCAGDSSPQLLVQAQMMRPGIG